MLAVWLLLATGAAMARDPDPLARVALEPMGYETLAPDFLLSGSSMLTVDFVDKDHLLVTFGVRRLMKREVDPPPDDDDRTIAAFLVELPSGKVLARTEWRLHDRAQYLWALGHGRFLLRVRDRLTVFAPMEAPDPNEAFREYPFLHLDRRIVAVLVSADDDLLTVESTRLPGPNEADATQRDESQQDPAPVQINFYRLTGGGTADKVLVVSAGAIRTRSAVALPMTAAGFLDVLEGGRDRYLFNFDSHAGKVSELAEFDSSCFPHSLFVGHGEFVAFGCRGSADRQDFAGFNLNGDVMWQQNFLDTHAFPTFAFAPAAGRFALGRMIVDSGMSPENLLSPGQVSRQEVRVYQSYDGKLLTRTECTPQARAGQNFALSPDGLELAVVQESMVHHAATQNDDAYTGNETAVMVYALPGLSDKDRAEVKAADGMAPADTGAPIDLALLRTAAPAAGAGSGGGGGPVVAAAPAPAPAVAAPAAAAPAAAAAAQAGVQVTGAAADATAATNTAGDAQPEPPRQAPTLYGPGDGPKK